MSDSDPAALKAAAPHAPSWPRTAALATLLMLGAAAAQSLSVLLWVPAVRISTIWVPGGYLLAVALLSEPRAWPVLVGAAALGTGALFAALGLTSPTQALVLSALGMLQTVLLAAALRRALPAGLAFDSRRDFLVYLAVALVGGTAVASSFFLAATLGFSFRPTSFEVWRTFALTAMLGYLTVTPALVVLARRAAQLRAAPATRHVEATVLLALLGMACALIFRRAGAPSTTWALLALVLPGLLLWATMRFHTLGASTALFVVAVFSTLGTNQGLGPFADRPPGVNTLSLQLFLLGIGVPLFGLGATLGERERVAAEQRRSRALLRTLNRDLMRARETEASRIARELHDDLGQRLALVSIGLSRVRRATSAEAPDVAHDVAELQAQLNDVASSMRQLSRELHPAELSHLGLVAALQARCDEVARVTGLAVRFDGEETAAEVPEDVALCLFRVAQEALANVVRHAGATRATVSLRGGPEDVALEVSDDGRGFATAPGEAARGLGLYSMEERVLAAGGTLDIRSVPGGGTSVRARIRLSESADA